MTMQDDNYLNRIGMQPYLKVCEALRRWDPIGVFQIRADWSKDEYDGYAPELIQLLESGADAELVSAFLIKLASDNMGMEPNRERSSEVAQQLVDYWKTLD